MKYYLITFYAHLHAGGNWVRRNAVIKMHPADWLVDHMARYGHVQDSVLTFTIEISHRQFQALDGKLG